MWAVHVGSFTQPGPAQFKRPVTAPLRMTASSSVPPAYTCRTRIKAEWTALLDEARHLCRAPGLRGMPSGKDGAQCLPAKAALDLIDDPHNKHHSIHREHS